MLVGLQLSELSQLSQLSHLSQLSLYNETLVLLQLPGGEGRGQVEQSSEMTAVLQLADCGAE